VGSLGPAARSGTFWLAAAAASAALIWNWPRPAPPPPRPQPLPLSEILAGAALPLEQAESDHPIELPADHGAHPSSRAEVWGLAAALTAANGRQFHLQFNLFRVTLTANGEPRPSAWAAHSVYSAHLALTDAGRGDQTVFERLSRDALGLAGTEAQGSTHRLWLEDWTLDVGQDPGGGTTLHLKASQEGLAVDLHTSGDGLVLTDGAPDRAAAGGASMRGYRVLRLTPAGTLTRDSRPVDVTGRAWLDHAWGNRIPDGGQLALARFSIHLDDDRDLLCLHTSRRDGSGTPIATCTLIGPAGDRRGFDRRDLTLEPQRYWISPRDGTRYPVAWRLTVPDVGLDLNMSPLIDAQELDLAVRLWSGGVTVTGTAAGVPLTGVGQVDLMDNHPKGPDR
jgi:predicted secreted hydrolase